MLITLSFKVVAGCLRYDNNNTLLETDVATSREGSILESESVVDEILHCFSSQGIWVFVAYWLRSCIL